MKKLKPLLYSTMGAASLGFANSALAQSADDFLEVGEDINLGDNDIIDISTQIVNIALGVVGLVAVIVLIYGGFLMVTAAGNEERAATAKKLVISAVIGLFMIFASWGLTIFVIENLLNTTT